MPFRFILLFSFFITSSLFSQKVGLVLSGGGASGLAHIGVLKALEENKIHVDYITGTSSGALIGSLYAIGYSPKQIEDLITSDQFLNWANGNIETKYDYFFKKQDKDASWIQFKVAIDTTIETSLPTNIINSAPVDFGLMEVFATSIAKANYNFDSLLIPFRCVASDIDKKEAVVFNKGDLGEAVRASMSYPFYLKPLQVNGRLLFDGGLYNNFPSDIMMADFNPDFVIGCNVSDNAPAPNADNVLSQIRSMMTNKTNYNLGCENGVLIKPQTNVGLFDFESAQESIDSGYASTMRQMEQIKKYVNSDQQFSTFSEKRKNYTSVNSTMYFDKIIVDGVSSKQAQYISKSILGKKEPLTLPELKQEYYKLLSDDKIKNLFPKAVLNKSNGLYDLKLNAQKEKQFMLAVGGNFSNRPISTGFIGVQYNYLGKSALGIYANTYFGRLYSSAKVKSRWDVPAKLPFFIQPMVTYNRWDYFKSQEFFFEDVKPSYLIQTEQYAELSAGTPAVLNGRISFGGAVSNILNEYYQTDKFLQQDTADRDEFKLMSAFIGYENNSLNRKMYANAGNYFSFKARYVSGSEINTPGSTGIDKLKTDFARDWIQLKMMYEKYFFYRGTVKLGVQLEGVYSTQPHSVNYASTILAAPSFQPTQESKTLFLDEYRAHKYIAGGLKNIITIKKNIDLRLEAYIFLPYEAILKAPDLKSFYGTPLATKHYAASVAAVYNSPVGPLSVSVNYYDREVAPVTFLFHFGYILFNKRSLE